MKYGRPDPFTQPLVPMHADTPQVAPAKKGDWRLLNKQERHEVVHVLSVEEIMSKHNVARSTAYEWKKYEV